MITYFFAITTGFLTNLTWILFFTALAPQMLAEAEETNLLDKLAEPATTYAKQLAQNQPADYNSEERIQLRTSTDLLLERGRCEIALSIAKQIVAGLTTVSTSDWLRINQAASCANIADTKDDAVFASWLGMNTAANKNQRRDAMLLLAAALENHAQYGTRYAIAAYREAVGYGVSKTIKDKLATLEQILQAEQILRLARFYIQKTDAQPAICLEFNAAMPEPSEQNYGDFIRFAPPFQSHFRKSAFNEICADGATFGATYQMSLLPELAATDGSKVTQILQYKVDSGNREPKIWFSNSRYVLPLGGGVPIHGINVSQAELTLYRIVDRNLLNEDVRNMFRSDLYPWRAEQIQNGLGEKIWNGTAELNAVVNQDTITNLPLTKYAPQTPGIYILTALPKQKNQPNANSDGEIASLWLLISDLGITSYQGTDGMMLSIHSLATSKPLGNIHLTLYARNNSILGATISDEQGVAKFPKTILEGNGGREPLMLMANDPQNDFNFLDVSIAPYDLSDRGVAGRVAPGPTDAFLYTERGVYRPGETMYLTALLRDDRGQALDNGLPLTVRVLRSDNQVVTEQVLQQQGAGGYSFKLPLSMSARAGRWNVNAFLDPKAAPIGTVSFQVEDVVPPRLEVNVGQTPTSPMQLGASGPFTIQAQYLFGAPGANLTANGEMRISADPVPFPQFTNYHFGPVDEADDSLLEPLTETRTDELGNATFAIKITNLPKLEQPLLAHLRAEVVDIDGRAVATTYDLPVRTKSMYIGILVPGDNGYIQEGSETKLQIITVDAAGQALATANLNFKLVEEQANYQWYREDGTWKFKRQIRDRWLQEGTLTTTTDNPALVTLPSVSGSYRLEVLEPKSGTLTSARAEVGWVSGDANASTPDRLIVRADRKDYRPGDTAKLTVQAPFTGSVTVVLAAHNVLSIQNLDLTTPDKTIDIPVDGNWAGGVYALVTAYRPDAGTAGHGPRRAVGVAWLSVAQDLHQIAVTIDAPTQMRPRQPLPIAIKATNFDPKETMYATLAAVDEGVLQLTNYSNPNPLQYYFGQRSLGVSLRDLYGQLIDGHQGTLGQIRSGGDEAAQRGAPNPHIQIVSLFSDIVPLDAKGQALIPLQLPDFNGKLRLMAVVWSKQRVGQTTTAVTVRDPVVLLPSVPRFLAAGDRSQASLLINNVEGATGAYQLNWNVDGNLTLLDASTATTSVQLAPGNHKVVTVALGANSPGNGALKLRLTAPNGEILERNAEIGIRPPFLPEWQTRFGRLRPGASTRFGRSMIQGLRPETVTGILTVSTMPALNVPSLLRQLEFYPYGCLEQVVSQAFPLLHLERLSELWDYTSHTPVTERLLSAITQLLEKQQENGAFGMWNSDNVEEPWLSAYALDFLQQAKANGIEVPDLLWNRGIEWLRGQVFIPATENAQVIAVQTYALYLLARNGDAPIETARYLLDREKMLLPSALSAAQLGAALAIMGDNERAAQAFAIARNIKRNEELNDYGSPLRDLAALVLILSEMAQDNNDTLVQTLTQELQNNQWLSTQEQAWIVRSANSLTDVPALLAIKIQGIVMPQRPTPLTRNIPVSILAEGLNLTNIGPTSAWYSLAVIGSPADAPLSMTQGLHIRRSLFSTKSEPIDTKSISQGTVMVVMLEGNAATTNIKHKVLILDPLPAGIEIENSNLANAASAADLHWIGELTPTNYTAELDDRLVAALDLDATQKSFKLAYLARAVTPGHYRAPPPWIEDMYRPRYRGRGKSGWIDIAPARP